MLQRPQLVNQIATALARSRIVGLMGPRQCGKTTVARQFVAVDAINYFDLEDPTSLVRLDEPMTALRPLQGLVVIDEIQRRPDLFPILRVLADREGDPARFLILGSASGELQRQAGESLAGRIESISMSGFRVAELAQAEPQQELISTETSTRLWLRGGFPRSYLAGDEASSLAWRKAFVQTLLERDFPQWGVRTPATALLRFWTMLAHYHGQTWNAAEPARALGQSEPTMRHYLNLLTDALMVRQLQPYHANIRKRQVKAPKVYIRDSGLLHQLLGVATEKDLLTHPKLGASWEGLVIEQILVQEPHDEAFFWATHQGAEVDLVLRRGSKLYGVEIKRRDAPTITPSIRHGLADLGLQEVVVVYPGEKAYPLSEQVRVLPFAHLASGQSLFADER
ncbi:MAG: ATP-binding protein [Planctomycetota bacterium]|jgi:predicted AAA+ superfamily ATPase|nr:ATP-binding protein [Planctomycetota bacterium]